MVGGSVAVFFFVLADMLDGAMARERGGGTRFGAVLDATCDRIADGAVFCGLAWWIVFGMHNAQLLVATLVCLVTSQVISYIKARARPVACGETAASSNGPSGWSSCWPAPGCRGLFGSR